MEIIVAYSLAVLADMQKKNGNMKGFYFSIFFATVLVARFFYNGVSKSLGLGGPSSLLTSPPVFRRGVQSLGVRL